MQAELQRIKSATGSRLLARFALVPAIGTLAILGLAAADPSLPTDDAYISFSYARTFAAGAGLALTPGAAPVEGFSNPLWVVVLAVFARLGASLPVTAVLLSFLIAALTTTQMAATTRRLVTGHWWAVAAAWLFVIAPGTGFHLASGLETLAATLALFVAFDGVLSNGSTTLLPRTAAALLALALLRPEGVAVFAAWALIQRDYRRSWKAGLLFLLPFGAYLAFRLAYFGQALPNSVIAKRGLDVVATLAIGQTYVRAFVGLHAPVLLLAGIGLASVPRRVAAAALVPAAVLGTIAAGGAHVEGYPFQRYLFPLVPLAAVLATRGAVAVVAVGRRFGRPGVVTSAACLFVLLIIQIHVRHAADRLDFERVRAARDAAARLLAGDRAPHDVPYPPYHRLSAWLAHRGYRGGTIAMQEIGITAFYSGLDVLDTFGLANAHLARVPGRPSGKADPTYVFARSPDVIAIRLAPDGLRPGLLADDVYGAHVRLAHDYDLARFFPDATSRLVAVFTRRDHLEKVVPLQDRLPESARLAGPAPDFLREALPEAGAQSPALAAAARLHFKRWIEGAQWNPATADGSASLRVDVPDHGVPLFEVSIAPPRSFGTGTYVASIAGPDGTTADAVRAVDWDHASAAARDLSIDLSPWRGRRVVITLAYVGGPRHAHAPGWLIWIEPRLTLLKNQPSPRVEAPMPRAALDAAFVEQRVPQTMIAGRTYPVSITMRNTGHQGWTETARHRLGSQRPTDGLLWGIGRVTLDDGEVVGAGAQRTFHFTVTAPAAAGAVVFQWRMLQEGREWFGATTPPVTVDVSDRP